MQKSTKLMNKNFFLLWQGNFVSKLGSQAFAIAMMFWLKHETGSASLMGLIMMLSMLPAVILSPIAGTLADQYPRRKIIIICDLLSGLPVLILGFLILLVPGFSDIIIVYLFAVSLLLGIVCVFRLKPATHSGESCHPFRFKPATCSGRNLPLVKFFPEQFLITFSFPSM
jgi:MFS family permease